MKKLIWNNFFINTSNYIEKKFYNMIIKFGFNLETTLIYYIFWYKKNIIFKGGSI